MRMFRAGIDGGRPAQRTAAARRRSGSTRATARILRAPNEPLVVPGYAEDGGEEAEIAGIYLIGSGWPPEACGNGRWKRVLRPQVREAELPESCRVEAAQLRARSRVGARSRTSIRYRGALASSGAEPSSGNVKSPRESAKCATAWRTSSITTSSSKGIGGRAIFTFITTEPTA